jgi:thiol-disulfide isomerase/thioredoxin
MLRICFILLFFLYCVQTFSQNIINVNGRAPLDKNFEKDTIFFGTGRLSNKYYEDTVLNSEINNNAFNIKGNFSYPQMYSSGWKSEKNKILFRSGKYFIDQSTTLIMVTDSLTKNAFVIGKTGQEYMYKFTPYILSKSSNDDLEMFCFNNEDEFDLKLYNYVIENPDSYVALWFLIERFNSVGYSNLFEKTLDQFSNKMKSEKLWNILNNENVGILIRKDKKFPELLLQNVDLKPEVLKIKNSKFTLIDFWFSRCRPCLEQLPYLKDLYLKHNLSGFDIIGISTDKTENIVNYWQKRIVEKEIPWKNFLDENGTFATKEKIFSFPTNFLVNEKGIVIKKNINPEELEKFLSENLK